MSHCSSMVKVVTLNYTETQERVGWGGEGEGGEGGEGEGGSLAPAAQHAAHLPGSFPPALIPDTARCR